ncbi:AraC family transcriptional regulator [Streptomyces sp. CA-250714]|uniref:AraC family transcriptional regulator n=1 Tax=Streptomyces sp. CA-250714 TaxID=3240060 RepID=UPI003D8CC81E
MVTTADRTVTVHIVRAVLGGARRYGIDVPALLHTAGIPPLLLADDEARVTAGQLTCVIHELYRRTGDEFLGLGPAPSKRGTFAMMCYAAGGCRDLGTATRRAIGFYGLFPQGPQLALETAPTAGGGGKGAEAGDGGKSRGDEAVFVVRDRFAAGDCFLAACVLTIWHRLSGWLIGRRIPLRWIHFDCAAPPYHREYAAMFGCPVTFEAPRTAAGFPARLLAAPVVRGEAELELLLRRAPAELLTRRKYDTSTAEQVRHWLRQALHRDIPLPELAVIAERLAVSPATLRRRLAADGTSFQQLKDAVRRDAALGALAQGTEPIAALAERLGFSEDTAFHRAFRRWTGTTPGAYRAHARAAGQARASSGQRS